MEPTQSRKKEPGRRAKSGASARTAPAPPAPQPQPAPHQPKPNGAFVIVLDERDRTLVGRMSYKPGKPFTLPGGGVERGEPFDVAAVIELHEEADYFTGAFGIRLVGVMPQRIPADPKIAGTLVLYECRVKEGQEFSCRDGELEDLQFMSLDKALGRVDEFHRPMLRLIYLAHAFRNGAGSPGHFSANMTSPVPARKSNGDFVII